MVERILAPFRAAVVSGGSSGIGRRFISDIGQAKPSLVVCNLSRNLPAEFAQPFTFQHVSCDLASASQRAAAVESVLRVIGDAQAGPILLVNNAGIGAYGPFPSDPSGRDVAVVELNVAAVVDLTARLLPLLRSRGGAIINVASTAAFQATPYAATYGASKAFLLNWSLALREELRPSGIPVVAVCPGPVRTPFFRNAGLDGTQADGAMGIDDTLVVHAAFKGLERNRGVVVPGFRNKLIAFASGIAPRTWAARVSGKVLRRVRNTTSS